MSKWWTDTTERTLATAAECGLGYLATRLGGISPAYAIPIGSAIAVLKAKLATFLGDPQSASATTSV